MFRYILLLTLLFCVTNLLTIANSNAETYIVHVELPPTSTLSTTTATATAAVDLDAFYQSFLPSTFSTTASTSSDSGEPRIIYSYHNVFHGFAARLTPEQAKAMETKPGFVSARPQKTLTLHTTHSPNFLGLNQNMGLWRDTNYGRGVIIGLLDSGINPNHPSFNDEGMPPPPAKWKGRCEFSTAAHACNNKLIGARFFSSGSRTPLDQDGHGTHTASTAAGNFVRGANVFGNANGTAAGIAPLAHVAMYKVCSPRCSESDVLAGMDSAIDDGVDIISLSLGGPVRDFYDESIAVGAFTAMERGIFVSAAAGNAGPRLGTVDNGAPWILTVGATTVDRKITATAVLGNKEELDGESTFQPADFPSTLLPLVYASLCTPSSLRAAGVVGNRKIVVCEVDKTVSSIRQGQTVRNAGGAAMIVINQQPDGYTTHSSSHVLPATHLSYADGVKIKTYLNSTATPTAGIKFKGTIIGDKNSPALASFSSRGPNPPSPGILKPDIVGPGHNILAAWHISVENNPNAISNFNIISGTSMSCPHLSGVAAILKNAHPKWSPAAIKSAMMTTADRVNLAGNPMDDLVTLRPANVWGVGSGHVNVLKSADPGLVYDILPQNYLSYLCGLNYTDQQIGIIASRAVRCSEIPSISEAELNYPSFTVFLENGSKSYNRTVTNVGEANEVYTAGVGGLPGVEVKVEPKTLQFSELNQKLTYKATFSRFANASSGAVVQGFLTWSSAKHSVRSPIVVLL